MHFNNSFYLYALISYITPSTLSRGENDTATLH